MYIRQCSEQGWSAHGVVHGILQAFLTTITTPAMHDNNRSSRADDVQSSSVSSIITNSAALDPGYTFRLPIPGYRFQLSHTGFTIFLCLLPCICGGKSDGMASLRYSHAFIILENKARRKPSSSPTFDKRRGFSLPPSVVSTCTYVGMHACKHFRLAS